VVGHVIGIVRMAIVELGDNSLECIEHVCVGTRVEVGGGERGCRMQDNKVAHARLAGILFAQQGLHTVSNIQNFALAVGLDHKPIHSPTF
jgi:hypothetical protein